MIGGNAKYTFYRPVKSRDSILKEVKTYPADDPLFSNVWCRKIRRQTNERVEVQLEKSSRPLVEDFILVVPIAVTVQADDLAHELSSGNDYLILGAEDVSQMGETYQCPIVRVKGIMAEAT